MSDLRSRFDRLDEVAVPDLWGEIERRAVSKADMPDATALRPRIRWGAREPLDRPAIGGRRLTPVPALLVLLLVILAMLAAITAGAGWGWWNRDGLLLIPQVDVVTTIRPDGDCPGAMTVRDGLPPSGWMPGPQPGWFATPHPGRITGIWAEPLPALQLHPPAARHVLVELDPVARTMCRLVITSGTFQGDLLDGGSLPDIDWSKTGDALAYFHGDVEEPNSCCDPGRLTLWTQHGQVDLPVFLNSGSGSIDWSNHGDMLAVTADQGTHSWADPQPASVGIYRADGSGPLELTFDCQLCIVVGSKFSPDDSRVAVTYFRVTSDESADRLIGLADTTTGSGTVLDVGPTQLKLVGWRDNDTILAVAEGRRLVAIPIDAPAQFRVVGDAPTQLGPDIYLDSWSPDHSRALYKRFLTNPPGGSGETLGTDLLVLDLATGTTRLVAHETGDASHFVWAPDNRTLAYTVPNNPKDASWGIQMHVTDALAGNPVAIAMGVSPVAWRPVWR